MPSLQQQILAHFAECPPDVREVVADVLRLEQEQIHLERPRVKDGIESVLDRVARETLKGANNEN